MAIKIGFKSEYYKHQKGKKKNLFINKTHNTVCSKNSFAALNIIFESDENVQLSFSNAPAFNIWKERKTFRIDVKVKGLDEVKINPVSYMEDDEGRLFADCIEEKDYMEVLAYNEVPIYVHIPLSKNIEAKEYPGKVYLYKRNRFSDEELVEELDFSITVTNYSMPKSTMHLDLWQHLSNIARAHDTKLFSDDHFLVIEEYVKSLSYIENNTCCIMASDIPWSGQNTHNDKSEPTDLYEYNYINTIKNIDDSYSYDFSIMQRYIDICEKYDICDEIEVFGLFGIWMSDEQGYGNITDDMPNGIRIRYFDKKSNTYKYMKKSKEIKKYIKALYDYFIKTNVLSKVRVIADEPADVDRFRASIKEIIDVAPKFKLKTAINRGEFTIEFDDYMADLVPSLKCLNEDSEFILAKTKDKDKRILWYVCCNPQFPNTFIKSELVESPFIGYLTSILNLDGFLRWNYCVYPSNPRKHIAFRTPLWLAGDMNFVYPGNNGKPLKTIRYYAMKRLVESFNLLEEAKKIDPSCANYISSILLKDTDLNDIAKKGYTPLNETTQPFSIDIVDYDNIKIKLLNILD